MLLVCFYFLVMSLPSPSLLLLIIGSLPSPSLVSSAEEQMANDMVVPKFVMYNLVNRMKKNSYINALSPKIMFFHKPKMIWFRGAEIGNNLKFQRNTASYSPKGHNDNKSLTIVIIIIENVNPHVILNYYQNMCQ